MKTGPAVAEILKREGVEYLFAYPVNHSDTDDTQVFSFFMGVTR